MAGIAYISRNFGSRVKEGLVVHCSAKRAYEAIWDVEPWPTRLPHVTRIELLYNDGHYQEFIMDVSGQNGDVLKVRSVRRRLDNEIDFFQPEPPRFLRHHAGRWVFKALARDKCKVTVYHFWTLSSAAREMFPASEHDSTEQQVEKLLRDHSKLALSTWKNILEAKQ